MKVRLPYHKTFLDVNIPDENFLGILTSKADEYKQSLPQDEIVRNALSNPIGSPTLEELVKGKKEVLIITSDHTRPVPSKITMPILLDTIRRANPNIDIKIMIATGFHRPTTKEEMINKFGEEIVKKETIINHMAFDNDQLEYVGLLPSGGRLYLNKMVCKSELVISEGFIEPHFFAGFSGGRKSILPGVAGATSVMENHCAKFIASPYARTGNLENNPIHKDMLFAAKAANLAFILNVVIDKDKKIINAFSGDSILAHEEGCKFVKQLSSVKAKPADIVISTNGGYPLDQNLYQSVKGMTAAEATCRENGVIIMVAACNDGHGGESFYNNMKNAKNPREILDRLAKVPPEDTAPDQWEFQILSRILDKHTVIFVTDMCDPKMIEDCHMIHAYTVEDAIKQALKLKGNNAKITVIPDGVSVIVEND